MPIASDNNLVRMKLESVKDDGTLQRVRGTGRHDETYGKGNDYTILRAQNYGFSAHPPQGSLGLVQSINGHPDQAIASFLEHPDYRPKNIAEGEWKIYDMWGGVLWAKKSPSEWEMEHPTLIRFKVGSSQIEIRAGHINIIADVIHLVGVVELGATEKDGLAPGIVQTVPGHSRVNAP